MQTYMMNCENGFTLKFKAKNDRCAKIHASKILKFDFGDMGLLKLEDGIAKIIGIRNFRIKNNIFGWSQWRCVKKGV